MMSCSPSPCRPAAGLWSEHTVAKKSRDEVYALMDAVRAGGCSRICACAHESAFSSRHFHDSDNIAQIAQQRILAGERESHFCKRFYRNHTRPSRAGSLHIADLENPVPFLQRHPGRYGPATSSRRHHPEDGAYRASRSRRPHPR